MWFNLDIRKLAIQILPTFLRGEVLSAYLKALVTPIDDIHYRWLQNRKQNLYILAHNGQKCYLRAVLNDEFDPEERRIQIDDGSFHERIYIYTRAEIDEQPYLLKRLGTIYLYDSSEYNDTGADFFVKIPNDLEYNEFKMKYLIDFYKLADKRYKIITI